MIMMMMVVCFSMLHLMVPGLCHCRHAGIGLVWYDLAANVIVAFLAHHSNPNRRCKRGSEQPWRRGCRRRCPFVSLAASFFSFCTALAIVSLECPRLLSFLLWLPLSAKPPKVGGPQIDSFGGDCRGMLRTKRHAVFRSMFSVRFGCLLSLVRDDHNDCGQNCTPTGMDKQHREKCTAKWWWKPKAERARLPGSFQALPRSPVLSTSFYARFSKRDSLHIFT